MINEVRQLLTDFQKAMAPAQGGDSVDLGTILARLDQLAGEGKGVLPGELLHYLQRRSYQKACALLQVDSANGPG